MILLFHELYILDIIYCISITGDKDLALLYPYLHFPLPKFPREVKSRFWLNQWSVPIFYDTIYVLFTTGQSSNYDYFFFLLQPFISPRVNNCLFYFACLVFFLGFVPTSIFPQLLCCRSVSCLTIVFNKCLNSSNSLSVPLFFWRPPSRILLPAPVCAGCCLGLVQSCHAGTSVYNSPVLKGFLLSFIHFFPLFC